jgi:hypothetical protein
MRGQAICFLALWYRFFGYTVGFVTLAAIALGGLIFFALLMPETKPDESPPLESPQGDTPTPKRA